MPPKRRLEPAPAPMLENLDFRAASDDAWYTVRVALDRDRAPEEVILRVMYHNFLPKFDEWFRADQFDTIEELEVFQGRFRPLTLQLQDEDCRQVTEGLKVCVAHAFAESVVRFYDANVVSVIPSKHQSICNCTFVVRWLHGDLAGKQTHKNIQDICLLQSTSVQSSSLDYFLDTARENIYERNISVNATYINCASSPMSEPKSVSRQHEDSVKREIDERCLSAKMTHCISRRALIQEPKSVSCQHENTSRKKSHQRSTSLDVPNSNLRMAPTIIPRSASSQLRQIINKQNFYAIRIENMDQDLSLSAVMDFIYEQTSIWTHVELSQSLLPQCYSGVIYVKNEEHAERLLDFLLNPANIVVSTSGRPWLLKEDGCQVMEGEMPRHERPWGRGQQVPTKLRLLNHGSNEQERARKLQKLHKDFHDHLENVYGRLESEERKILLSRG